ncbi:MAG: DUF2971 domain-containing protein [Leptothrix sp. (in: b-proteobacteria)]
MKQYPSFLYKYCHPDRVDVLINGEIRYSQLESFNDPFEGRPEIKKFLNDVSKDDLPGIDPENFRLAYAILDPETKSEYSFDDFLGAVACAESKRFLDIFNDLPKHESEISKLLIRLLDMHRGVLCLSEVPDSLLMWAHYAASHSGYVIEFDARHQYFNDRHSSKNELNHLHRVLYRETRPSLHDEDFGMMELSFTKSGHWAYEREWRITRSFVEANKSFSCNSEMIHLFKFPPEIVRGIILGARISQKTESKLRKLILSDARYSGVRLRRSVPDSAHFHLRMIDETV